MTSPAVHPACVRRAQSVIFAVFSCARIPAFAAALVLALPGTVHASASGNSALASHPLAQHVREAARRFAIPETWIWAVMRQESGGNAAVVSHAGARGLMQIMPATWAMLTARYDLGSDPFEVRANIHAGAAYLRLMWDRFGDLNLTLAAYNAGPGRVDAYARGQRGLPFETVQYVARIAPSLGRRTVVQRIAKPSLDLHSWRASAIFAARERSPSPDREAAVDAQELRGAGDRQIVVRPVSRSLFAPMSGRPQ